MRVGHAVLGGTAGFVWLMLPVMTSGEPVPVAIKGGGGAAVSAPAAPPAPARRDRSPGSGLLVPLAALGTTTAFAGYGYVRRARRARTRTTPGGTPSGAEAAVARQDLPVPSAAERRAAALSAAEELLPAALADAEAELRAADRALSAVRDGAATGNPDPVDALDALRHVVRARVRLGAGRTRSLSAAALLVAGDAVSGVDDFFAAHGTTVGRAARTRLAQARRLLASPEPEDLVTADTLAQEARALAEQDVRRTAL